MSVKLYSFWKSTCSWRVRIALALKGVKYEYVAVDLFHGEQHKMGKFSPMSQVPTLIVDGQNITQSLPIVEFIDEKYCGHSLLPADLKSKTKVREICEMINSGIQPLQNLSVLKKIPKDERKEWGHHFVKTGLAGVENLLQETAGKYSVGDNVTAADVFLVPQVITAVHRFDVDMSEFPIISRINSALESHEAFIAAHPYQQPDAPKDDKQL